ncbi:alcohol dehydrogenase groES-like domain-containing protein [Ditylenchus destructor]|nr:alcohol dehydrogenase groES-like domain-containing protein [Ditylenchus destructor]
MSLTVKSLVYKQNGLPEKVISLVQSTISTKSLGQSQVLVRWLAAPINPLDFAKIMGVIKEQPPLPAIGGTEGCGVVEKIGSGVTTLKAGDLVIPAEFGVGTWRTHGVHESKQLTALGKSFSKFSAAMLFINPPTAYRLLKDFVELKQGDVVAQNGANSACGRYIIQVSFSFFCLAT